MIEPVSGYSDAVEWADQARSVRYGCRNELRAGNVALRQLLDAAKSNEMLGRVTLLWVLESVPGAGKVRTRRKLAELGVEATQTIGALDDGLIELLVDSFGAPNPGPGEPGIDF